MSAQSWTRRDTLGLFALASTAALASCASTQNETNSSEQPMARSPLNERVQAIVDVMSTRQKIEQLLMPSFRYIGADASGTKIGLTELLPEVQSSLERHAFGGVLLFEENLQANGQAVQLIDAMQTANAANESQGRVPLMVATDQEGGESHRILHGCFLCGNMALGATGSEQDVHDAASIAGAELAALGINTDFAPVLDVNSNPENPVIGVRSFGDDAQDVARLQAPFVQALRENGIVPCGKHFPGHGDTSVDSHTGLPRLDHTYDELAQRELIPFKAAIDQGLDMMMCAHVQFPAIEDATFTAKDDTQVTLPATLSKKVINELLRQELGFGGVVCTDSMAMGAIVKFLDPVEAARMALEAGADLILEPLDPSGTLAEYLKQLDDYVDQLVSFAEQGTLSLARVDEAVGRVLSLKMDRGILDSRANLASIDERIAQARSIVGSESHHAIEEQSALHAITLTKNDNNALPVQQLERVLVLVEYESQATSALYAASTLAAEGLIYDASAITVLHVKEPTNDLIDSELAGHDVAIAVSTMYGHNNLRSNFSAQIDYLLERCKAMGIRSVVVSAELPYDLARYTSANAQLACYYGSGMVEEPMSVEGEVRGWAPNLIAALGVAFGKQAPTGTLPVSIPQNGGILYERGWGLTYDA